MQSNKIILGLLLIVVLLVGIIVGMFISKRPLEQMGQETTTFDSQTSQNHSPGKRQRSALSQQEYWMSNENIEKNKYGYAVWIVLKDAGNVLVEKCLAPVYDLAKIPKKATRIPLIDSECTTLLNGRIISMKKDSMRVRDNKRGEVMMSYRWQKNPNGEVLELTSDEFKCRLIPGSKNALTDGLKQIPSVKAEYENFIRKASSQIDHSR